MSTVAAISTPVGKGGIAVIRISGDAAIEIASRVFLPANKKLLSETEADMAVYGGIFYGKTQIDDGIAVVFKAPRSFTGEDTVEISCHGGVLITKRVLEAVFAAGAQPAGAGEFTKRAFLNGKLSLSEAEAIGGLIDAKTDKYLSVSLAQSKGSLGKAVKALSDRLVFLAASVYAFIDYPDEDMTDVSVEEMRKELNLVLSRLDELISTHRYGKAISEGVDTAIVGKPNTGKSSLLNMLCGEDRAIVTDIAGTTRDIVTEQVNFGGVLLRLSDTAGIRQAGTDSIVEEIGINKSKKKIADAEVLLAVFDGSKPPTSEDRELMMLLADRREDLVAVVNKTDILEPNSELLGELREKFKRVVKISAKTGEGAERLQMEIEEICGKRNRVSEGEIVTSARQNAALLKARGFIASALESLSLYTQDIASLDIENAVAALDEVDARVASEQIVNEIFSKFCVGK